MKTAKEKAAELYSKMLHKIEGLEGTDWYESAKQCAIATVDELINSVSYMDNDKANWISDEETFTYWQEVKNEIELL